MKHVKHPLSGWYPGRVTEELESCSWLYAGEIPFDKPFFSETANWCRSQLAWQYSNIRQVTTSISVLPEWAEGLDSISPSAFIFHTSRCGSTLATQALALDPANVVLSEVPFLNDLLMNQEEIIGKTGCAIGALLTAAFRFYGQKRRPSESHFVIKLDSWHLMFYRQLRELYPEVPFILLYRNPGEVLASQARLRGTQAIPNVLNPAMYGLTSEDLEGLNLDDYMALVLEKFYTAILHAACTDDHTVWIDYAMGAENMVKGVADAAGIPIGQHELSLFRERFKFHSKYPDTAFSEPATCIPETGRQLLLQGLYEQINALKKYTGIL